MFIHIAYLAGDPVNRLFCLRQIPFCRLDPHIVQIGDKSLSRHVLEISGKIAQQLYQNSTIAVSGYENADLPDSFFDIVVGNVPFGDFKVEDKKYDKYKFQIHDYFFAKSLDKVRPRWSNSIYYFKGNNGQAKFSF